jgi:hypothetical protein
VAIFAIPKATSTPVGCGVPSQVRSIELSSEDLNLLLRTL